MIPEEFKTGLSRGTVDARHDIVEKPLIFQGRDQRFEVPVGFVTDMASVPRAFWTLWPPVGVYSLAAVLHDYLYATGIVSRKDADGIFRRAMRVSGTGRFTRWPLYWGVRLGGWFAWRKHRKSDKK